MFFYIDNLSCRAILVKYANELLVYEQFED